MSNIDYMKIFDAAAASLNAADHINVEALDLNRYVASIMMDETACIDFNSVHTESDIELSVEKTSFTLKDYRKFLSLFEYNLEQKFLKNIKLDTSETAREYKIKISF